MTINRTAVTDILKRVYGDRITDLFARQKQTYNEFAKSPRQYSYVPGGDGYYFALRTQDIESVGAREEDAFLPEPLAGDFTQGRIRPRYVYATLRLSGPAVEAGRSNAFAFANIQGDSIMNTYNSLITDLNRQAVGDGYGALGTLSAQGTISASTDWTLTCDNATGVRYVRRGMLVEFYNSSGTRLERAPVKVKSVDPTNKQITFNKIATTYRTYHPDGGTSYVATQTTIAADSVFTRIGARDSAHATTDTNREMMGLLGIYDDGTRVATFENITVSGSDFKANILGNSSVDRELSIDLMLAACDLTASRSSRVTDLIRLGLGQRRKYFALLSPDVRYAPAEFHGGYETLRFSQDASIAMRVDPALPPGKMFFEATGAIRKYELTPIGWGGMDDQRFHWREMYDQATAFLRLYTELGTEDRRALTLIEDLSEPASATMPW